MVSKEELLEKIFEYLETEIDVEGKTTKDYPGYYKIKKFLQEKIDIIDDRILLMGDILVKELLSILRLNEDNIKMGFDGNCLIISNYTATDKVSFDEKKKREGRVTYIIPNSQYTSANVRVLSKSVIAEKVSSTQDTYDATIAYSDRWYDSASGLEITNEQYRTQQQMSFINPQIILNANGIMLESESRESVLGFPVFRPTTEKDYFHQYSKRLEKYGNLLIETTREMYNPETRNHSQFFTFTPSQNSTIYDGETSVLKFEELKKQQEEYDNMTKEEQEKLRKDKLINAKIPDKSPAGYLSTYLGLDILRENNDAQFSETHRKSR